MSKLIKEIDDCTKSVKEGTCSDWSADEVVGLLHCLKRLAEKELPKPVKLPKFVIEIIEQTKKDRFSLSYCLDALQSKGLSNKKRKWLYASADNEGKVAQAWLTGNYEEEKEQLYVVKIPYVQGTFYTLDKNKRAKFVFGHQNAERFTEEELERYLSEIKQFAEKVEEAE
ncbi:DUF1642 domain-containing protein [Vagococcus entomophilus]|nr:DUF1642 domain-containing protein [Vagococcus entomophilus]